MEDTKPRHEAYSYASAGDIEPAEEFPILYRLLTAEGKGTKRSFSSSSSFISSHHSYFPINFRNRSSKNSRKRNKSTDNNKNDNLISSTVEADSTSDISLTHILARSKFMNDHHPHHHHRSNYNRGKNNKNGGAINSKLNGKRKGKRNEKVNKDSLKDDEMMPSSTTNDDNYIDNYFYQNMSNINNSPPARKRARFPQSLKRALIFKKSIQSNGDDDDDNDDDMNSDVQRERQLLQEEVEEEPLLISSLSVNERLAVLLGQQQVNNDNNASNNNNKDNNSINETKPPSLVPRNNNNNENTMMSSSAPSNKNIFLNTQNGSNSSNNRSSRISNLISNNISSEVNKQQGALRTLLSRPPSSSSSSLSSHRKLIFPTTNENLINSSNQTNNNNIINNEQITKHCSNINTSPSSAFQSSSQKTNNVEQVESQDDQKKIRIKGVVEQLRAAASQKFSFKRSFASANHNLQSLKSNNSEDEDDKFVVVNEAVVEVFKCLHCDLTFKRLYHLSRHETLVHGNNNTASTKSEKFYCSFCSQEFLTKEQFQIHVEECFDNKYPPTSAPQTPSRKKKIMISGSHAVGGSSLNVITNNNANHQLTKQYIGLSELLEAKIEDSSSSPPTPSSFHSLILPTK